MSPSQALPLGKIRRDVSPQLLHTSMDKIGELELSCLLFRLQVDQQARSRKVPHCDKLASLSLGELELHEPGNHSRTYRVM